MKQNKSLLEKLKTTQVSVATGALALVTLSLAILDYVPSLEVEGSSVLQANSFALLDMARE